MLSFGGRKQLVISVLQSLQLYWMSVFIIPNETIQAIEALIRKFLWAQGNNAAGKCKIAWDIVTKPIDCGGLGFKKLKVWNQALVGKNLWDILCHRKSLWVRWVWENYIHNQCLWRVRKRPMWSWVLRSILDLRNIFRRHMMVVIGDGNSTNAWEDPWLPCGPLSGKISYRRIYASGFNAMSKARDVIDHIRDRWPIDWLTSFPELAGTPIPVCNAEPDKMAWRTVKDKLTNYSVKDAWKSLENEDAKLAWTNAVWFKGHIPKHAFCMWIACHNRLPTQDRIRSWKSDPPDMQCEFCGNGPDSHSHLFFECDFPKRCWRGIRTEMGMQSFPDNWNNILIAMNNTRLKTVQKLSLAAAVYTIWKERNRRIFQKVKKNDVQIIKEVRETVRHRMAWKSTRKLSTIYDD